MMNDIILASAPHPLRALITGEPATKNHDSRLGLFCDWLDDAGLRWHQPDLAIWRDHLLYAGKAPRTVAAYLSTVRGAYKKLLRSNDVRDLLYQMTDAGAPADIRKAFVDELIKRLENATHPDSAPVEITTEQDTPESSALRLTKPQAEQLLESPDTATLAGARDVAVIAVLLCTGIREDELCQLTVDDLRQHLYNEMALRVRRGKGNKQRLIPYGEADWCLTVVDHWLACVGIEEGYVFRGLTRGGRARSGALTTRAVQDILAKYPISIAGVMRTVKPHDCRRTYARLQYEAGADLVAIQQNLGHTNVKTTLGYIGDLDASARRTKNVLRFKLGKLYSQKSMF
ncbi:MAG: tyrosine-type recombinase/integrase [Acidobacteriales bacterium]|nr:tyrosine-type recombinase/integrase [Terriglobales bacterium]